MRDFVDLARTCGIVIEEALVLNGHRHRTSLSNPRLANLFGEKAIFPAEEGLKAAAAPQHLAHPRPTGQVPMGS